MKLVIIEGPTSTGKSTLARKLAKDLDIAMFLKDDYKEKEFDSAGRSPNVKQWTRIEKTSWQQVLAAIKTAVETNKSLIVEGNFFPSHGPKIKALLHTDTVIVEIFCYARGLTILKRYVRRNRSGERHKGHRDHLWYPVVALEAFGLGKHYRPLKLSSNLLRVNTTDFDAVDYEAICQFIENAQ